MHLSETGSKTKVLIADDEPVVREMISAVTEHAGYDVECVSDGVQAWERIQTGEFRMLVTDWQMPGLDGIELCRKIRVGNLSPYVYIVVITGRTSNQDIVEGLSAGADDFLSKPVSFAELEVRLKAGERVLALESRNLVIFALAKLAESRDPETGAHIERMQLYSRILAAEIAKRSRADGAVPADFAALVDLTSPLHDIGKIGIPDVVLLKPGRYNDEEFDIMKNHTVIGAEAISAALELQPGTRYLEVARDIALYHHERFDGSGYPHGLRGEAIPLSARVVALADVYDALTSKRMYKDAFTHLVAKQIIVDGSGTHFDPALVEAFIDLEPQFVAVRQLRHGTANEKTAAGDE